MGLFSFFKHKGDKLLTKKNATAVKTEETQQMYDEILRKQKEVLLTGVVDSLGIEIENKSLNYQDDTVTIYGQVHSQSDKEKLILALGNVSGVASVDDRISVTNPEPEAIFYTVKRGDTLGKIAKKQYGNASKYTVIFEANTPMLKDPNKIFVGQVLRIPAID